MVFVPKEIHSLLHRNSDGTFPIKLPERKYPNALVKRLAATDCVIQ